MAQFCLYFVFTMEWKECFSHSKTEFLDTKREHLLLDIL